jgi:hypothetical protein
MAAHGEWERSFSRRNTRITIATPWKTACITWVYPKCVTWLVADDDADMVVRSAQLAANTSALMQLYTYDRVVRNVVTRLPFVEL